MPAILLKFLGPAAPYLAAAVLGLFGFLYVSHLRGEVAADARANAALTQTNQADAAAIADYQAQEAKYDAALDALDARTLAVNRSATGILNHIDAAPPGDDAPVAPVLAGALAEIAKLQGTAP